MKEPTKINLSIWHVEAERENDHNFILTFHGQTKNGEGNSHEIRCKIPYSWTGFLLKILRDNLTKQIDRFQTYFKD